MDSLDALQKPFEFSSRLKFLVGAHALLPLGWAATNQFNDVFVGVMFSFAIYQYGLMGLWTGLGPWPFGARVGGALLFNFYILCVSILWLIVSWGLGPPPENDMFKFLALFGVGISTVCIAPHLILNAWLKLARVANPNELDRQYLSRIGIRHLLVITFCYGVVIAATGVLKRSADLPLPVAISFPLAIAILLGPLVTGLVALSWSVLTPRFGWLKLLVAIMANGFAALLMIVRFGVPPQATLFALPGIAVFVASLLVLRRDGYRLVWRRTLHTVADAEEPASPFDSAEISPTGASVFEKDT